MDFVGTEPEPAARNIGYFTGTSRFHSSNQWPTTSSICNLTSAIPRAARPSSLSFAPIAYTVYSMARPPSNSTVLTLRVPAALDRRLAREARRRRQTRSEVARAILEATLGGSEPDLAGEARRQSLLVRRRRSEREALDFILNVAVSDSTRGQ